MRYTGKCALFCVASRFANAPFSPASLSVLDKHMLKENGAPRPAMDELTRAKAESRYPNYYEYYVELDASAQGNAPFE